jgi:hypothetical protein
MWGLITIDGRAFPVLLVVDHDVAGLLALVRSEFTCIHGRRPDSATYRVVRRRRRLRIEDTKNPPSLKPTPGRADPGTGGGAVSRVGDGVPTGVIPGQR